MSEEADSKSTCAACGMGGGGLKACSACKLVKYCNVTCQRAHRPKHKEDCKRHAAESQLFKTPPPREECPLCCLPLLLDAIHNNFKLCCSKIICIGCAYATQREKHICPFCRSNEYEAYDERSIAYLMKHVEAGDAMAMQFLGSLYYDGDGVEQDEEKALELWHKSAKLGCAKSHFNLGIHYVKRSKSGIDDENSRVKHHWELAAIGGDVVARHNLGIQEEVVWDMARAMKHYMIAARFGYDESLTRVREGFINGFVTKNDYELTIRLHHKAVGEMKSEQRDEAKRVLEANK